MNFDRSFFPIGATYAPLPKATEVDIDQWPQDLENIKKLGLTTFRIFICWDRIEIEQGMRDFSRVDRIFDLAEQNGLRVIANVGGTFTNLQAIYPPRWLVYDKKCTLLKPTPDASEELHFNRFKLCYDNPTYQAEAKNFIQEAIARYRDRYGLIAWSGWNEPRLAECYCRHTVALYRQWLAGKYPSLRALEQAWSTEFPVRFRDWDDVFPQPVANFESGGYIPFLDWREFLSRNRTDKFHLIRAWIKEMDPVTPVISHLCGPYEADIFGKEDILGTSVYTIHAQGKGGDYAPYEYVHANNIQFITEGQRPEREDAEGFWVVETEAGPVSWVHDLAPRSYSPRKMNARDMYLVANGARAILRWLYRSRISDAQASEFNMVGWDGRITERAEEFGRLAQFLKMHADLFMHHRADQSGVFILDVRDCDDLSSCEGYGYRYSRGMHYLYNALLHIGVRGVMCNARQILSGILDQAKVLIAPFRPHVSPEMAQILRAFVARGGTLLAESPFATKDMRGIHYEVTPGGMTDVFGAQVYDLEKLYEPTCGGIPAFDFRAKIELKGGKAEGYFANGDPAIVTNTYGKGRTVLYGSLLAEAYQIEKPLSENVANKKTLTYAEGEAFRVELRKRLLDAGVSAGWEISDLPLEDHKHIQVIPRKLPDGRRMVFVLNMNDRAQTFQLHFPGCEAVEELGGSKSDPEIRHDSGKIQISISEWGWSVLISK